MIAPEYTPQTEVGSIVPVSPKTLERLANAGFPVGRQKLGTRVLFHVPTLRKFMQDNPTVPTPPRRGKQLVAA